MCVHWHVCLHVFAFAGAHVRVREHAHAQELASMCLEEGERKSGRTRHPKQHHMTTCMCTFPMQRSHVCVHLLYKGAYIKYMHHIPCTYCRRRPASRPGCHRSPKENLQKVKKKDLQGVEDGVARLMTGLGRRTASTIDTLVWQDLGSAHCVKPPYARNRLLQNVRVSDLGSDKAQPRG